MASNSSNNSGNNQVESPDQSKKKSGGSLQSLLKNAIVQHCGRDNVCDPYFLDAMRTQKKNDILQELRQQMSESLSDDRWSDIDASRIENEISDTDISLAFEKFARPLHDARKMTFKKVLRAFPSANIDHTLLTDILAGLNENELTSIVESRANIRRYLLNEYKLSRAELEVWDPKLKELFQLDTFPEGELKDRLVREMSRYESHKTKLSIGLISELVDFYANQPQKIQEIGEFFQIEFSLREAVQLDFLTEDSIEKIAEKTYSDIWDSLKEEQKKSLIHLIRTDDTFLFDFAEIQSLNSQLLANRNLNNKLKEKINMRFQEFQEPSEKNDIGSRIVPDKDGKWHENFLTQLDQKLRGENGISKIDGIENFSEGKVLVYKDSQGEYQFVQLLETDVELPIENGICGVTLAYLHGKDNKSIGVPKGQGTISYEKFEEYLKNVGSAQIMDEDDLRTQIQNGLFQDDNGDIIEDHLAEETEGTLENLKTGIDRIDPESKDIPFGVGTTFSADVEGKGGKIIHQTFTVTKLDPPNISISNGHDADESTIFSEFIQAAEKYNLRRIAVLETDVDFLNALTPYGVVAGTELKDHRLVTETEKDDGHGHKEKVTANYEYFKSKEGDAHIRVTGIEGDNVCIWEWQAPAKLEDVKKAKEHKKLSAKQEKSMYQVRVITRAEFLDYLKKNKLVATTDDLLDPHAGNKYHPHDPHMHGSLFGAIAGGLSINDIMKGFSNIIHGFEHYFEKGSKLNASRFALKMGRTFGFPADLMAQLQADEVSSVKELIEKIQEKLFNLNGPVARKKALHIAQLTSSRPEEVGAAMLYMVKSYGHLYAEDIAYAQGSETFINGFLYSLGFRGADITAMKNKGREKFIAENADEPGAVPTEEEMIWGIMKIFDGKSEEFPVAGTVVKAMGGPSGWEKAWRTEGSENAYQKGIRQGGDVVNAQGRVNKGLSAFKTHEYNTAIGFMEKAAGKTPHPSIQTIPVIWALGGYSGYVSTKMAQKVKGYGDSMGHTFHAYAFIRNKTDNDKYTKAFIHALGDVAGHGKAHEAQEMINILRAGPKNDSKKGKDAFENAIEGLAEIWDVYWEKGLHDHLQGKDTWLMQEVNKGNKDIQEYAKRFAEIHKMNTKDRPPSSDNDWWDQYGYKDSPMFGAGTEAGYREVEGKKVLSLERTMQKLLIDGYDFQTNEKDRLWPVVVSQFEKLRQEEDKDLQRAQYVQYRNDVIQHFRDKMRVGTRGIDGTIEEIRRKKYYGDLVRMGINPELFFSGKSLDNTAHEAYEKWKNMGISGAGETIRSVESIVEDTLGAKKKAANDGYYRRAA